MTALVQTKQGVCLEVRVEVSKPNYSPEVIFFYIIILFNYICTIFTHTCFRSSQLFTNTRYKKIQLRPHHFVHTHDKPRNMADNNTFQHSRSWIIKADSKKPLPLQVTAWVVHGGSNNGWSSFTNKYRGFVWKWVHCIPANILRELFCSHLLITKKDNRLSQLERWVIPNIQR